MNFLSFVKNLFRKDMSEEPYVTDVAGNMGHMNTATRWDTLALYSAFHPGVELQYQNLFGL